MKNVQIISTLSPSKQDQSGYLSLVAVLLIVVIGFLGTAVAFMFYGSAITTSNMLLSSNALYLAESGLAKGTRFLLNPTLSTRIACSAINGNANLTNSSFGSGTLTVTTVSGSPFYTNSALTAAISSSATTIAVASASGFAARGRILIDKEAMNYAAISGNSFIGVIRSVNGTTAVSHANGTLASQYQCSLDSKGGVPNLTSPIAQRELQQSVQLQEGWAIGDNNGDNFTLTHWNYPSEVVWNNSSFTDATNREILKGVSLTSNADGWAVGNEHNNNFTILHWNGSSWTVNSLSGACKSQHLNGVSAVTTNEAWAVGQRYRLTCATGSGPRRYGILQWNGASWALLTPPAIPADATTNQNLNAVHVIDSTGSGSGNIGFAVGGSGDILQFNGSQWLKVSSPVTSDLNSVFVVSSSEAWAVGSAGVILKWNGSSWSSIASPTGVSLNSIFMVDTNNDGLADLGWAVGDSGVAIYYNGSTWVSQSAGGGALRGVAVFGTNDAWAVGDGGRVTHWDGTSWTDATSNVSTQLNAIAIIASKQNPHAGWQEIFP